MSTVEMLSTSSPAEVKAWGTTRCIIHNSHYEQHLLEINRGGFCSVHFHQRKWQNLHIISGMLRIRTFNEAGRLQCSQLYRRGEFVVCPPGLRHQFFAPRDCVATEIYTPNTRFDTVDPADIVRLSEGGCDPEGRGR